MITHKLRWVSVGVGIMLACLTACTPKPMTPSTETPETSTPFGKNDIYRQAEDQLQAAEYEAALDSFLQFVDQSPMDDHVDSAMFNIGIIYKKMGEYDRSLEYFTALMDRYPLSPLIMDVHIEMIEAYAGSGQFVKADEAAGALMSQPLSDSQKLRVQLFLADAYMGWGFPAKALPLYADILANTSGEEADRLFQRLEESIRQLNTDESSRLLEARAQDSISGSILFHLGSLQASQEDYALAQDSFTRFVASYPEHEKVAEAYQWLDTLFRRFTFEPNTVGCLLPLTGPYATYGKRALKGIELALSRKSAEKNLPLRIVVKDTASDPERAVAAVKELVAEGASSIVGPFATAEAAAESAQRSGIPIITITQKDRITELGSFVFRNFITPRMQVKAMADYVMGELRLRRFAILYPAEPYGVTFMALFWDEILKRGGEITGVESYDPEQTDFASPIKKIVGTYYDIPKEMRDSPTFLRAYHSPTKPVQASILGLETLFSGPVRNIMGILSSNSAASAQVKRVASNDASSPIIDFDAIFIPDAPKKAGLIIPQLAYYDVDDVYLLGTNLWHSQSLIEMSRQYVQGALMADGFFAESRSPEVRSFVAAYQEIYDEMPGIIEAIAYDNAMILLELASRPEISLRTELRDALMNLGIYPGVTGATLFTDMGEAEKQLYLLRIRGKEFIEVGTGGLRIQE